MWHVFIIVLVLVISIQITTSLIRLGPGPALPGQLKVLTFPALSLKSEQKY